MPVDDKQPVAFDRQGAARIVNATRIVEAQYRNPPVQGNRFSGGRNAGMVPAKVGAGGITAFTPATTSPAAPAKAGTGDVTLCDMDAEGNLTETGVTLTAWNLGGSIAGGGYILVDFGTRGPWPVVQPCL